MPARRWPECPPLWLCFQIVIRWMLAGATGKTITRAYINATVGLEKLGAAYVGPRDDPQARNLFSVIKRADVRLHMAG
jgi:hypothetical protein